MPQREVSSLADRLKAARRRRFVGRQDELQMFRDALRAETLPFSVLFVYGPGGVGKTSLLREFAHLCQQQNVPVYTLDGLAVEPSPRPFLKALAGETEGSVEDPVAAIRATGERQVLIIDRYDGLKLLDRWLRREFLPRLPDDMLIVLAGRRGPDPGWQSDPGWRTLLRKLPLRNLSPDESVRYLTQEDIPQEQHQAILNFTHGHPLALSLVADLYTQRPDLPFDPEASPNMIRKLVERFMENVPGPAHRVALEACAMTRVTTEPLLADMVASPDAHELFEWLRSLSFIEENQRGLAPHSVARDALAAELRWRNPDWYAELHKRARDHYLERVQASHGRAQQEVLIDYIFLHRDNPVVQPFFQRLRSQRDEQGALLPDAVHDGEWEQLAQMVARHEGEASAALARHWFARQPENVTVYRDDQGAPAGFFLSLTLEQEDEAALAADPATEAAWHYLEANAPLREGEKATHFRFWMAAETYQSISPTQSLIFVNMVGHYLTTPGLAFTFLPCANPQFWASIFAYADLKRIPGADFTVGDAEYGVYGHDWRAVPPMAWLDLLAQRETAADPQSIPRPQIVEPALVLSREEFETAVRDALRHFARPDQLADNPLLRSRLVLGALAPDAKKEHQAETLQALIRETADTLKDDPRSRKFYRALYHTYLQPAPTQERAAEAANVPFGSFRRHLRRGIEQLTDMLWQREIGN